MIFTNINSTELKQKLIEIGKEYDIRLAKCQPIKKGKSQEGVVYNYVDDLFKENEMLEWIEIEYISDSSKDRYEITWKSYYKAMSVYYFGGDFTTVDLGKKYDATPDQFLTQVIESIDAGFKSVLTIKIIDSINDALNDFDSIDFGDL